MSRRKGFFTSHSKSSAVIVSLAIHAALIVVAFFLVAVTVIQKDEVDFAAKPASRPKMNLRKLQIPVNTKQPPKQPKLRRQIVARPKLAKSMPDIKMPEIVGVKGGIGAGGSSLGGGISLGFSLPEIDFFGIKGKSERIMLILDGGHYMSSDDLGGAYGFEVIKQECLKLVEGLPPTAVFNIVVYGETRQLFTEMVPASPENVQKARDWLTPLNQVKGAQTQYGIKTLGPGGSKPEGTYPFGKFKEDIFDPRGWNESVFLAMKQQADTVFLLTGLWGFFGYNLEDVGELRREWNETSAGKDWNRKVADGRKKLDEENKKRKAAGEPPSSLNRNSELEIVRKYFPGTEEPPQGKRVYLDVEDLVDAFTEAYKTYARNAPELGIKKKRKSRFSLNVIYFKKEKFKTENDQKYSDDHQRWFEELAKALNGRLSEVVGLEAIENYVK